MNNINELLKSLEEKLPQGYVLTIPPENENSSIFALYKFNPRQYHLLEAFDRLIKKYAVWNGSNVN